MIERIRLEEEETYTVDVGNNQVVVILCLDGVIEVKGRYEQQPYAVLNRYETWTLSSSYLYPTIRARTPTAEFLIVRYFRA